MNRGIDVLEMQPVQTKDLYCTAEFDVAGSQAPRVENTVSQGMLSGESVDEMIVEEE